MINNILISKDKRKKLHRDTRYLGVSGENLQEILIFNLDEDIVGQGIIEIEFEDGTKGFVEIERTERGYELPVKSSLLTQSGTVKIQLRILQDKQEVFKSEIIEFIVRQAINATETIPEQYPTWIDDLEVLKVSLEESESKRVTAENARTEAEIQRAKTFSQIQKDATEAVNNIEDMTEAYNSNATQKTNAFNNNATSQTNAFNQNSTEKTSEFNANVTAKTEQFNTNVTNKTTAFNTNAETKINEYNSNAQAKLNEYDEHAEEMTTRLQEIETKNTEQDTDIEELQDKVLELESENEVLKNQIPTGQAEGENITLNDSAEMEFKELKVGGNSWQETRSGKNKFDISKATKASGSCSFKNNGDSIDITATYIGEYMSANIDITDLFKEGETIYAKANFVASSSNTGAYRIQWGEDTGLIKGDIVLMSSTSDLVKSGVVPTKPEGATKLFLYLYGNVAGTVAIGDTVTYSKIMLSNQPITDYEECGAMPSPEFPSEIKNVTGSANIIVCNENVWDEKWELGSLNNTTGEKASVNTCIRSAEYIPLKPNTTYYFKTAYSEMCFYDKDKKFISSTAKINETFTTDEKTRYLLFRNATAYGTTYNNDIMLAESNTEVPYTPHQEQTINFPLSEGQRLMKGDYLADDGIHHKRGQVVLDGSDDENWSNQGGEYDTDERMFFSVKVASVKADTPNRKGICNYFINSEKNVQSSQVDITAFNFHPEAKYSNYIYFKIEKSKLNTLDETAWKKWLQNHNLIVEYELAEEVIEPYTEEQQIVYNQIKKAYSYKNITHIFSTNELSLEFEATYRKDLETLENNKEERLLALENAVLGGN